MISIRISERQIYDNEPGTNLYYIIEILGIISNDITSVGVLISSHHLY